MRLGVARIALALVFVAMTASAETAQWIQRSNENSKLLNEAFAKYSPEAAAMFGIDGYDTEVTRLWPDPTDAVVAEFRRIATTYRQRLANERDPRVAQDLQILIDSAERGAEGLELNRKNLLPYADIGQLLFRGFNSILSDQVPAERRATALVRLRKYAGMETGIEPITKQAELALRAAMKDPKLRGPFKDNLEKDLANSERYLEGIEQLFKKYDMKDSVEPMAKLRSQFAQYADFARKEVAPRASTDFRLPEALYRYNLREVGVDMPVEELVSRAKVSFREIQNEMQTLAALIAKQRNLPSADYRDVIAALKKEQLQGAAILPAYQKRLAEIEAMVKATGVVSLPARQARIRLASEAESAAIPAPHVNPPRFLGNTGEMAEFVLPLRIPSTDGSAEVAFDDFTFDAASWTLTVHEARPGHELQFASIMEKGVSDARVLHALNSTNLEGWALYMEAEMKPQMPLEGQLISLQHRLMRAARAILDPSLQLGWIDRDAARRMLEHEVVLSPAMAQQEVERYTWIYPAQATSYFCGYNRLMEMRADAERMLGDRFDRRSYHDFILAQGVLPLSLLRKAVLEDFVPSVLAKTPAASAPSSH